jgi:K+-transporting ATPase ATPase C chain
LSPYTGLEIKPLLIPTMKIFIPCFRLFLVLMLLTGVIYPLAVTAVAQLVFHDQAEGSPVSSNGKLIGSTLLSQKTESPKYFWPRPSAGDYATVASGTSNLGPSSDALKKVIADRATQLRSASNIAADAPLPDDMITASASGLDPHISPTAAQMQIDRVAQARGFNAEQKAKLTALVKDRIEGPQLGFLGEPRVNVLLLNLALDELH